MKFALLAASALAFTAVPALAQDAGAPPPPAADSTAPMQDSTQTPAQDQMTPPTDTAPPPAQDGMGTPPATTTADPAMGQTMGQQNMGQPGMSGTTGTMTQGGYAPSGAPMMGAPAPGGQVVFRPSAPVSQAFPPPAAKENYPVCSRTVRDSCRNPGSR